MDKMFLSDFLKISDMKTTAFLLVLVCSFWLLHVLYHKKQMDFAVLVLIATGMGLILGAAIQIVAGFPKEPSEIRFVNETTTWYALFGNGYLNLIRMIVIPLVMISILQVIINMQHGKTMGKLVKKTVAVTMTMTAIASIVGIAIGVLLRVGKGARIVTEGKAEAKEIIPIADTLRDLIPGNLIEAMVNNNIIGLVIFSAFLGMAIWWVNHENKEDAKPLYDFISTAHKAVVNLALLILDFMPWGVIALLANTIAQRGIASVLEAGKFVIALYLAVIAQFLIQMGSLVLCGISPYMYLKKAFATMLLAFTSRSSVGCLPMTIETLTKKMGVNEGTASFVAGFGTTAGMQGCAGVFPALLVVYVCHAVGTPVDFTMIIMITIVVTVGSLGIAGIPGTATMAASVSLSGMGMASRFSMISPLLAIDPIVDMPRTLLNVTGSMTNALIVDKAMGTLHMDAWENK